MAWQLKNKRNGPGQSNGPSSSIASQSLLHPQHNIHQDLGEDMVRQSAASQLETQKTAFMRWVNVQLAATTYVPMATIERDLRDGKRLIGLLEVVSKEPLKPERGNMRIHQMANVSKALAFLEKKSDESLTSIGNEDIVDGNLKLTLGLVWIIIYRFQIQHIANTMIDFYPLLTDDMLESEEAAPAPPTKGKKKGSSQQVDAKQALLRWVRHMLEDYSDIIPPVQDFHRSWRTGLAFAALIHRHDPDILPDFYTAILPIPHETVEQWRKTLTASFDLALEKMTLPRLLDPEDLVDVETPDERSIMTYVSEYYLIMSKHQKEQDPALTEQLKTLRVQAKKQRLAAAGEDLQAAQRRTQEEEERKRREEQEELERIRLRRMEIEGWSIRAAERAKEEEDARRKRREEEEEKSLQRKLRREQREREKALLHQQATGRYPRNAAGSSTVTTGLADSELALSESDSEPMDPEELKRRQEELDEKRAAYLESMVELAAWVQECLDGFPSTPELSALLDRIDDLEPFTDSVQELASKHADRDQDLYKLHLAREELLDFDNPDLTLEQVADVDKAWWDLDAQWTLLSTNTSKAKCAIQEMQWIIECSEEIEWISNDIQRFQEQLDVAAEKRLKDTLEERTIISLLEHQDVNLFSMGALLKRHQETLSTLAKSDIHSAPEHLSTRKVTLTNVNLPQLFSTLEVARQHLSNDRLLRSFLHVVTQSEDWLGKSLEWLASIKAPTYVADDTWSAGRTMKEYSARDLSQQPELDSLQLEIQELERKLGEERAKWEDFRSTGFPALEQEAKAVVDSMQESQDVIAESTTSAVQGKVQAVVQDLKQVEEILPREMNQCAVALQVLDYLFEVRSIFIQIDTAFASINSLAMGQDTSGAASSVSKVEKALTQLDESLYESDGKQRSHVWTAVQIRHSGLCHLIQDLRAFFQEREEVLKGDQQMKEFLDLTHVCQTALRDLRFQLHDAPQFKGFGSEETMPLDQFSDLVERVSESFAVFKNEKYKDYQQMGAQMTASASLAGSRQDPAIVQSKLEGVARLLEDISAFRADRERDRDAMVECKRVAGSLRSVSLNLARIDSEISALEVKPDQDNHVLIELASESSELASQFTLLEQESVYRYLVADPSCTDLIRGIKHYLSNIQQTQTRLRSGLEVEQQWSLVWEQFADRVSALQQYLDVTENEIQQRGVASMDGLADGDAHWKKSEDELHEIEVANNSTLASLKDFQKQKLPELTTLKTALQQSLQQEGDLAVGVNHESQYHEAESQQKQLREHLQRLYLLNSQEGFQLEILGQRLVWSQQLAESKAETDISVQNCQGLVDQLTRLLKNCSQRNDFTDLNSRTVEHLQTRLAHVLATAVAQKEERFEVTLTIYESLAELSTVQAPGEVINPDQAGDQKKVPLHLEVELYEFKTRYQLLDLHLDHVKQVVDFAAKGASYLRKVDSMDSGFMRMANDLQAEKEASQKTIEKLNAIRVELSDLTEEMRTITKTPKAADKIAELYLASQMSHRSDLDRLLRLRLEHSNELNAALDPLLVEFKLLLEYQNSLRALSKELEEHDRWINRSNQKVQSTHDQIKQMYSSWPGDELEQKKALGQEAMVIFDVDEQVVVDELDVLLADMEQEAIHVQNNKQIFLQSRRKVEEALRHATPHSKQLQMELEWYLGNLADKIQELESDIRTRSLQLQCLDKRAIWEKEIEVARSWFKDFAKTVILFAREQSRWQANHRDMDDAASIRSARTTASKLQMNQLGVSIEGFEEQVEMFEKKSRPRVNRAWSELCAALVLVSRSIPDEFLRRQLSLGREFDEIRRQVGYSANIVTQRKSLEDVAFRLDELEGYKEEVRKSSVSTKSGRYGAETASLKTKEKGWSRFQAKVKKLTKK